MPRRNFGNYKQDVLHHLGNPDASELLIDEGDIVNQALTHIVDMHPWSWLNDAAVSLSLTAGQNYVKLPSDFRDMVSVNYTESWGIGLIPATWDEITMYRQGPVRPWTRVYWYVVNTGVQEDPVVSGLAPPRLELYPTPATAEASVLQLVYRRGPREFVNDSDVAQWPSYMDRVLSLMARHFAAADYDDNAQSPYGAQANQMLNDLIAKDGMSRRSFGVSRGGVMPRTTTVDPFYPRSIPSPT